MSNQTKEEAARRHLQRKVKELHTHSYLTLLSIGQGVSFHLLAEEISNNRECIFVPLDGNFPWVTWLLCIQTFVLLILVWNDFFMVISEFTWIPSLRDVTILFCLFATEVFMAKNIMNPPFWLISVTSFLVFSLLAFGNTVAESKKRPENEVSLGQKIRRIRQSMLMLIILIGCLIFILFLGKAHSGAYLVGIFLSLLVMVSFTLNAIKSWRQTKLFIEGK